MTADDSDETRTKRRTCPPGLGIAAAVTCSIDIEPR